MIRLGSLLIVWNGNLDFCAPETVRFVARPDSDFRDRWRDLDIGSSGKGLLIHMRVQQDTLTKNSAVRTDNLPCVSIMAPPFISVFDRHTEAKDVLPGLLQLEDLDRRDIGLTGH